MLFMLQKGILYRFFLLLWHA